MGDNDKPFACPEPGCGMRFTNEDHLSVHRSRHQMSLTLTPGTKAVSQMLGFADQTPTPTKFLRNCEEVGLFNELKNPFEDAFRKATLNFATESRPVSFIHRHVPDEAVHGAENDLDTLNTPTPNLAHHTEDIIKEPAAPPFILLPGPDADIGSTVAITSTPDISESPAAKTNCKITVHGSDEFSDKEITLESSRKISTQADNTSADKDLEVVHAIKREYEVSSSVDAEVAVPVKKPTITQLNKPNKPSCLTKTELIKVTKVEPVSEGSMSDADVQLSTTPVSEPSATESPVICSSETPSPALTPSPITTQSRSVVTTPVKSAYSIQVMLKMPNGQLMPVQIPAAMVGGSSVQVATQQTTSAADLKNQVPRASGSASSGIQGGSGVASASTKQKLKDTITQSLLRDSNDVGSSSTGKITVQSGRTFQSMESPRVQLQAADTSSDYTLFRDNEEDTDERRKKFLERNRAAAARCRHKRKVWINNLEGKADGLQSSNQTLQAEVNRLRKEVAQLKSLMLEHRDCPVTVQQRNAGQIAFQTVVEGASQVSSAPTVIQTIPVLSPATVINSSSHSHAQINPIIINVSSLTPTKDST